MTVNVALLGRGTVFHAPLYLDCYERVAAAIRSAQPPVDALTHGEAWKSSNPLAPTVDLAAGSARSRR